MGRPALLETFETRATASVTDPSETDESWQAGFEAGYEQALQDMKAEQVQLSAQLVQSLNDQAFGYHEARTHLLDTLRPLFDELAGTFVPGFAREAFVPLVSAHLRKMATHLIDEPIHLRVTPELEPLFLSLVEDVGDLPVRVQSDDTLDALQAVLTTAREEAVIDLQPVLQEVGSILGAMTTTQTEYADHG